MIYTELTKKAAELAAMAHAGQVDKAGYPYILHPVHIAEQMDDEKSCCAALLHDVLEDNPDYTAKTLADAGMPMDVVKAVCEMTHPRGEEYSSYIDRVAKNPIARRVKIADLAHNMDTSRLGRPLGEADLKRLDKYRKSKAKLELVEAIASFKECDAEDDGNIELELV